MKDRTKPIYLDYNATTPIDPRVVEAIQPYLTTFFGNPSSSHWYGVQARKAVSEARRQVAECIGAKPDEIIFTSGGSESNNMAVKGVALSRKDRGRHIITSKVEHPAIIEVCRWLEENGFQITYLSVDSTGMVNPEDIAAAIRSDTILITIMLANNEVGTVQPLQKIALTAHEKGVLLHTDAA
ncbi:MAG: aminotransferase class V-fold PLP-dependent enzyme, partial [Candidatus Cloacimonetes bacterium]|nr:aminotransferase class V-fold PLP-dependent enzyme [Candidatus Cloacimonadota bacterium]